jgi:tRNA U34 5-carboxymethylaminomethyl modifying GTPase MnmE/TrmE
MAWLVSAVFGSVTSISEVVIASIGTKGLRLHKSSGARSFNSKSIVVTLKKEPRQLKTTYRKILTSFKPKIGESTLRIRFFKQPPSFTAKYLISTMNS